MTTYDDAELERIAIQLEQFARHNQSNAFAIAKAIGGALQQIRDARLVGPNKKELLKASITEIVQFAPETKEQMEIGANAFILGATWLFKQLRLEHGIKGDE